MDVVPDRGRPPARRRAARPHRSYLTCSRPRSPPVTVTAWPTSPVAGSPTTCPRVLPDGVGADVQLGSWPVPPLFELVRELTPQMPIEELYRTLNMGIGMVVVCAAGAADVVQAAIPEPTWRIGRLVAGGQRGGTVGTLRCGGQLTHSRRDGRDRPTRRSTRLPTYFSFSAAVDGRPLSASVSHGSSSSVVLASGNGSNLQAIIDGCAAGRSTPRSSPWSPTERMRTRCTVRPPVASPPSTSADAGEARADYDARLADVVAGFGPDWSCSPAGCGSSR